jgi:hypothetical protein
MSVSRSGISIAAALVVLAAACSSPSPSRFLIGSGRVNREVRIDVVNDNFSDIVVYVVREASNLRLGEVVGKTSGSFTLSSDQIPPGRGLMLMADPIGSRGAYFSDAVTADPGSWVVLTIGASLAQSYITMR